MKPFDLAAAIRGEKVVDNTGSVSIDFKVWRKISSIEFLFERNDGHLYKMIYSVLGSFNGLFMAPIKKKGWIVICPKTREIITNEIQMSENVLITRKNQLGYQHITIPIEWEE